MTPVPRIAVPVGRPAVVDVDAAPTGTAPVRPVDRGWSRVVVGTVALVAAVLVVAAAVLLIIRTRPVTHDVAVRPPGDHGTDAVGCPIGDTCRVVPGAPQAVQNALTAALGPVGEFAVQTTEAGGLGTPVQVIASAAWADGRRLAVVTGCVPGGSARTARPVQVRATTGGHLVDATTAPRDGCSVVVSLAVPGAPDAADLALVKRLATDPRLVLPG